MTEGSEPTGKRYIVTYTANLHVTVTAKDEEDASFKAFPIASWTEDHFDNDAAQTGGDTPQVSMSIHSDDPVTIDELYWDPVDRYGTPEHEAWLMELERRGE